MQSPWKNRVQEMLSLCQEELKKTTEIGKKMINASKTSSELHETYESLGHLILQEIKDKNITWDNPEAERLISIIESKEEELEKMEGEVRNIKKNN
jgi:hypothetical protein